MPSELLAVDLVLTISEASPENLRTYALSMVWANAAARSEANKATDGSSHDQAWVDHFFRACSQNLGRLGWRIKEAGKSTLSPAASGPTTTLADVITKTGASRGARGAIDRLKTLTGGKEGGKAASDEANALLSFWWQNAFTDPWLACGVGSVSSSADTLQMEIDLVQIDTSTLLTPPQGLVTGLLSKGNPFKPQDAGGLFVDVEARSVGAISRRTWGADLDFSVFEPQRETVASRLGAKFAEHYKLESGRQL